MKEKQKKDKKKIISIIVLIVGIITLAVGVVMLILRLTSAPATVDADYLVQVGSWEEEGAPGVIWTFTEVGHGTLTTNNHQNDYDFAWMLEDGKLRIQTDWLYMLDDEFEYSLDQGDKLLTLSTDDSSDIHFRPASSVNTEVTEGN